MHGVCKSYFHFFFPKKTLGFPYLVEWCASNFSSFERVIMDSTKSKILFPANGLVVRDSFSVPASFTLCQEDFNKENLIQYLCESSLELKQSFFNTFFRSNVSLKNQAFLVDTNLFNEETKLVISLVSQFLGFDTYKYVTKMLMSIIFRVSTDQSNPQSSQLVCLKFDEFLAESIHS